MHSTPNSPTIKHCAQCGVQFTPHKLVGQRQRFCCNACRTAWQIANGRAALNCTCKHCGVEFQPKKRDRNQFCSRACAFAFGHPERRKSRPEPKQVPLCAVCGKLCNRADAKTCSSECRAEWNRSVAREWSARKSERQLRPRRCKECGHVFTPEYGDKRQRYCSKQCMRKQTRRIGKAIRRARIRNATLVEAIDPISVFRRDGWRCKLCGCRTPKRLRGTTDDCAPELDHVVPLAKGGAHSYANTQCACRKCNQAKGVTIAGQAALL